MQRRLRWRPCWTVGTPALVCRLGTVEYVCPALVTKRECVSEAAMAVTTKDAITRVAEDRSVSDPSPSCPNPFPPASYAQQRQADFSFARLSFATPKPKLARMRTSTWVKIRYGNSLPFDLTSLQKDRTESPHVVDILRFLSPPPGGQHPNQADQQPMCSSRSAARKQPTESCRVVYVSAFSHAQVACFPQENWG